MENRKTVSALIGLVGAVGNNGKTENTDKIILSALKSQDCDEVIQQIHDEKFAISPNCQNCTTPCGNTSDCDMDKYFNEKNETTALKIEILKSLQSYAESVNAEAPLPNSVYKAISYLGYDLDVQSYKDILEEINND